MRRTLAAIAAATAAIALALPGPASAVGPTVDPNDDKHHGSTRSSTCGTTEAPTPRSSSATRRRTRRPSAPSRRTTSRSRSSARRIPIWWSPGGTTTAPAGWAWLLHRRRGELDRLARARIRRGHIRRGHGLTRVRADERRERPGRGVQRRRDEVLLRLDSFNEFAGEDELGRVGRQVRRARARAPASRTTRSTTSARPGSAGASGRELLRHLQRQGDGRGRPLAHEPVRGEPVRVLDQVPRLRHAIRFRASSDEGLSFSPPVNLTEGGADRAATSRSRPTATSTRSGATELSSSHKNFGVSFARSTDGGLTFSKDRKSQEPRRLQPVRHGSGLRRRAEPVPERVRVPPSPARAGASRPTDRRSPRRLRGLQRVDPETAVPSDTSYSSAGFGTGMVGQSFRLHLEDDRQRRDVGPAPEGVEPVRGTRVLPGRRRARRQAGGRGRTAARTTATASSGRHPTPPMRRGARTPTASR